MSTADSFDFVGDEHIIERPYLEVRDLSGGFLVKGRRRITSGRETTRRKRVPFPAGV
jgi:hypothetical protein